MMSRRFGPVAFLVATAGACGPTAFAPDGGGDDDDDEHRAADGGGPGGAADAAPTGDRPDAGDDIDEPCTDVVDVLFVLDVSSSMTFVLDALEAEIATVVDAANALAPDAHFGLIAFADNHLLVTGGPLQGGVVHVAAGTLQSAFASVEATYTTYNRNPGDGPSGPTTQNPICEENANDALYAAAAEFPWRDDATRVIIAVTDDTFLDRPDNYGDRDGDGDTTSTDFPSEGDYPALRTMAETVEALVAARARVFSVTLLAPPPLPELTQCGTPRRYEWPAISDGWSTPRGADGTFAARTDGQNFDLARVAAGELSLSETINQVVVDSHCNPPIP
jgi:hypothetical protein